MNPYIDKVVSLFYGVFSLSSYLVALFPGCLLALRATKVVLVL